LRRTVTFSIFVTSLFANLILQFMEFKIDTKNTFSTLTPVFDKINAKLTDELAGKCTEMRQSGSRNFIIDLQHCTEIDTDALEKLIALHEESYGMGQSLVFTGISDTIMTTIRDEEADFLINIAPSMQEAVDIVSMEILERELLDEEG
jgi:anti-anti-sigma regulatory factor